MKIRELLEVRVGLNDPEMAELNPDIPQDAPPGRGPWAVGWSAQSLEWYGDDAGPESKKGRYKPKGDGGEIVAYNIPDNETAQHIADKLDYTYDMGQFYDPSVYAKHGKDWYVLQYEGTWIRSMSDLPHYWRQTLSHRAKDYGKTR